MSLSMVYRRAALAVTRSKPLFTSIGVPAALFSTSSTQHLIVNAVGLDRTGIVSDVTNFVTTAGGNVGESQAAKLGHYFSVLMMIEVPNAQVDSLKSALTNMPDMNLSVFEAPEAPRSPLVTPKIGYSGVFRLSGADNPGIVYQVTKCLASHNLNIDSMESVQETIAPHGGTHLFHLRGTCSMMEPLPTKFDIRAIKDELEQLGDSLNCDVVLEEAHDDAPSASFYGG